jgi:hypothetical protein
VKKCVDRTQLKTRDKIGGTLKTDLYKNEDGIYMAYSYYWKDEDQECVAHASGNDPDKTVKASRKNLRKEWIEWEEWKMENPDYKSHFKIVMASGEIITNQ